jgi:hypothetical protein
MGFGVGGVEDCAAAWLTRSLDEARFSGVVLSVDDANLHRIRRCCEPVALLPNLIDSGFVQRDSIAQGARALEAVHGET